MSHNIHPTAIISTTAKISKTAKVGAYCIIGDDVILHDNVTLKSHICIDGVTQIGENTLIHPFSSIGSVPQDLKYQGEAGQLKIGKNNIIREHVTINIGTMGGGMVTSVGDNNLLMTGVHIGHDCHVGNHVILVNNATLAGHVTIGDGAVLGGLSAVHQFCRIGQLAMIGGMSGVENDVIPFGTVMGNRAILKGLNLIGLDRANYEKSDIHSMRNAYKKLFDKANGSFDSRIQAIADEYPDSPLVSEVIAFLRQPTKRRYVMPD
ncbi:MAG: UDP-N-acetylglucosamine acyltransferase [Dasania sp.]|jgi:UDP-N-acetylglucosamine acyltransferase